MLIVKTQIIITQIPSGIFPNRKGVFTFDFVTEFEANDSWRDFTNECTITIPKNVYYINADGKKVNLGNTDTNLGGFNNDNPAFLRGDTVKLVAGYQYDWKKQTYTDTATIFQGYITKVKSKKPFVLQCEDNMFKLKQLPAPNKLFLSSKYTLETMLAEILQGSGFTVNQTASTNIDDFRTQNETVMDVLARLRKDYHMQAFFDYPPATSGNPAPLERNQLYCGFLVVYQNPGNNCKFVFQDNIIDDDLQYNRKDDLVLSAIGYSVNKIQTAGLTKDGAIKTKSQRIEVLVTYQNGVFTSKINPPGQKADFPPNYTGERRTIYYPGPTTDINKVISYTKAELMRYYYTGFKGKFTTFGIPFVKQGDNAEIYDDVLPERNGTYKIKSVEYKFSVEGGLRQIIELDYRIGDNMDKLP